MAGKHFDRKRRRAFGSRREFETILIVCEGEKTEPNYFRAFQESARLLTIQIKVKGTGYNTLSLVEEAARINKHEGEFDQVWCVLDKDDFSNALLDQAFTLALNNGFKLAFSNEAFELWYLLHFDYIETAFDRKQLCRKLKERLGIAYKKNDTDMYNTLLSMQPAAIRNAKKLLKAHSSQCKKTPCPNPSTTVVHLVESLNKEKKKRRQHS